MSLSTQELLDQVDASIQRALAMQSGAVGGRSVTNANLKELFDRRDLLVRQLAYEQGGGSMSSLGFQTSPT